MLFIWKCIRVRFRWRNRPISRKETLLWPVAAKKSGGTRHQRADCCSEEGKMKKSKLFFGHEVAETIHVRTRTLIEKLGRSPRCTVLYDSRSAPMMAYAERQKAVAEALGIELVLEEYGVEAAELVQQLVRIRDDDAVDAAITLYPLPNGIDPIVAAEAIGSSKDADGLHPLNAGLLALGGQVRAPATARACAAALTHLLPSLKGAEVVIVGASRIVGRPLAALLLDAEATVTVCHAATRDLHAHTRKADVVVTAAGVPGLLGADAIRDGAILIDVSIVPTPNGLVGDVDLASVEGKAEFVSHVPDGIGPITTACLFENVARAALER